MSTSIPVTNGRLIQLAENESELRAMYMELKYQKWRNGFMDENREKLQTAMKGKAEIIRKYYVTENDEIKHTEGENPEPILKDGMAKEGYEKEISEYVVKKKSIKI